MVTFLAPGLCFAVYDVQRRNKKGCCCCTKGQFNCQQSVSACSHEENARVLDMTLVLQKSSHNTLNFLDKQLEDCAISGVTSDEYLIYVKKNREEWKLRGGSEVVDEMKAKTWPRGRWFE